MLGLPLKYILIGLAVIAMIAGIKMHIDDYKDLQSFKAEVVSVTRTAADRPNLAESQVPLQIKYLGESLDSYRTKIGVQNKSIADLENRRKDALVEAARQAALRKEVILKSQTLAQKLRTEAKTPVEKEQLEADLRRVQDEAWELGL